VSFPINASAAAAMQRPKLEWLRETRAWWSGVEQSATRRSLHVDRCDCAFCGESDGTMNHDSPGDSGTGARSMTDRRRRPTGPVAAFYPAGRRVRARRKADRQVLHFLDQFDVFSLAVIVAVLGLTLVDGVLTIELLDTNSEECNPLMGHLLTRGQTAFFVAKYLLTGTGLTFFLVYKNYPMFGTRFRVGFMSPIVLALYLALVAYQVALLRIGRSVPAPVAITASAVARWHLPAKSSAGPR
jgi:Domain of unknown function (DUF5658)